MFSSVTFSSFNSGKTGVLAGSLGIFFSSFERNGVTVIGMKLGFTYTGRASFEGWYRLTGIWRAFVVCFLYAPASG